MSRMTVKLELGLKNDAVICDGLPGLAFTFFVLLSAIILEI